MVIPPIPGAPIRDVRHLRAGDVVLVSLKLTDKRTGDDFWWKSFRVVTEVIPRLQMIETTVLRMVIDPDKDERRIVIDDFGTVVVKLEEHQIPQGVSAMLMKALARGTIKINPTP